MGSGMYRLRFGFRCELYYKCYEGGRLCASSDIGKRMNNICDGCHFASTSLISYNPGKRPSHITRPMLCTSSAALDSPLFQLPDDLFYEILTYLDAEQLIVLEQVRTPRHARSPFMPAFVDEPDPATVHSLEPGDLASGRQTPWPDATCPAPILLFRIDDEYSPAACVCPQSAPAECPLALGHPQAPSQPPLPSPCPPVEFPSIRAVPRA
jgi:hypothetical protein